MILENEMRAKSEAAFSLLETLSVLSLLAVFSAASLPAVDRAIRSSRVETATQNVIMQLRLAREYAVDQRRVHIVTFAAPRTITIQRVDGGTTIPVSQLDLPSDIQFDRGGASGTPDSLTVSDPTSAISFNGLTFVRFNPDGSGVDASGQLCNGVVFISRPSDSDSVRAATLFGATGRVKGFRYSCSGGWQ